MEEINKSTNVVKLNKEGEIELDGMVFNLRKILNEISKRPVVFIQDTAPTDYSLLDWWFQPSTNILCMGLIINNNLVWKHTTFGVVEALSNINVGSDITSTVLNNVMNDFYNKISEIGIKIVNNEIVKNDGTLTNGELAYRRHDVVNYIYNGDLSLPPLYQTGGKLWNSSQQGFNFLDSWNIWHIPLYSNNSIDFDSKYDYLNKKFELNYKYKNKTNLSSHIYITNVVSETAIEMLNNDFIFSLTYDVDKSIEVYLVSATRLYPNGIGLKYTNHGKISLTPGKKTVSMSFNIGDDLEIKNTRVNRKNYERRFYLVTDSSSNNDIYGGTVPNISNDIFKLTFYNLKINKGTKVLPDVKDDFRNMDYYNQLFPYKRVNTFLDKTNPNVKNNFGSGWYIPSWCTVTDYLTIYTGTLWENRTNEEKEILTAFGLYGEQYFDQHFVIKKLTWGPRDSWSLPFHWIPSNDQNLITTASFCKLLKGTSYYNYVNGCELNKWKLCGSTFYLGPNSYINIHPFDNNPNSNGGGEMLICMAGCVNGHVDLSNPTNWRLHGDV